MEDIGNLRLQMLGEFRNMESSFLTEVKYFKNEFLQSCVEHSPREQVNENIREVYKPTSRANIISKGTTQKQRQDHKLINKPTLKKQ